MNSFGISYKLSEVSMRVNGSRRQKSQEGQVQTSIDNIQSDFFATATYTPASDPAFGTFGPIQLIIGRPGNDTLYGFDQTVSLTTPVNIDVFFGDTEPVPGLILSDVLNTLGGNPPSGGRDRFVLGDWRTSLYTNNGFNDFALLPTFNPNEDVIQLNGFAQDYDFENFFNVGTAILRDDDLVAVVVSGSVLDPNTNSANFLFVGNTPPPGPVQSEIQQSGTAGFDLFGGVATDFQGNVYVTGITNASFEGTNAGSFDFSIAKYNSNGEQLFIQQFGGPATDRSFDIATDNSSNFYVVGSTQSELVTPRRIASNSNSNQIFLRFGFEEEDAFIAKYDSNGNQIFLDQFRFEGSLVNTATDVTVDRNGNAYVSGLTISEDGVVAGGFGGIDAEGDLWVTKYDTNGNQQWITRIGSEPVNDSTPPWEEAYGVALSPDGSSLYATGWTIGNLPGNVNAGVYDSYITKLSSDGQVEWIRQFGSTGNEFGWSIGTDSQGNAYAYGWTQGNLGGELAGFSDLFLAKYSPDGTQQFIKQFGTSGDDAAFFGGLVIDANDNIYLTGFTDSNFGGTNAGSYDTFVARFDTDGNQVWTQQFGTPQLDNPTSIDVDNFGNLYVTGLTEGSLGDINAGSVDGWIAKLDTNSGTLLNFSSSNFI